MRSKEIRAKRLSAERAKEIIEKRKGSQKLRSNVKALPKLTMVCSCIFVLTSRARPSPNRVLGYARAKVMANCAEGGNCDKEDVVHAAKKKIGSSSLQ